MSENILCPCGDFTECYSKKKTAEKKASKSNRITVQCKFKFWHLHSGV